MQIGGAKTGVGCYKCGKSGHWSRDCNVPKSQWIAGTNAPGQANTSQAAPQTGAPAQGAADALPTLAGKGKKRGKKPKLTFEVLQNPQEGLPVVFLTFARRFKMKFKGKRHEGSDLRRLLQMYEQWQRRLFPAISFDQFLADTEVIGRTGEVKRELRELRLGAIRMLEEEDEPEGPTSPGVPEEVPRAPSQPPAAQPPIPATAAEPGMMEEDWVDNVNGPDLDDEEYADMMDSDLENELYAMANQDREPERRQSQAAGLQPPAPDCATKDAQAQHMSPSPAAPVVEANDPLGPGDGQGAEVADPPMDPMSGENATGVGGTGQGDWVGCIAGSTPSGAQMPVSGCAAPEGEAGENNGPNVPDRDLPSSCMGTAEHPRGEEDESSEEAVKESGKRLASPDGGPKETMDGNSGLPKKQRIHSESD